MRANSRSLTGLALGVALVSGACSKKSSSNSDDPANSDSGTGTNSSTSFIVSSLSSIPDLDTFIKSQSTSAALLSTNQSGLGLVTGTPPGFKDIGSSATNIQTNLTGNTTTLATDVETARSSSDWTGLRTKLETFHAANAKCQVMEHTARLVTRLKEDTGTLCMLKNIGSQGDKVFTVTSGTAIADLTSVFAAAAEDKVLQIKQPDGGTIMFDIKGTNTLPTGFQLTMTMCDENNAPTQQNAIVIDNTTRSLTFTSKRNDASKGGANGNFKFVGSLVSDGAGGYVPDTAAARTVDYSGGGTFGSFTSSDQGKLTISGNLLNAIFFSSHSGTDGNGRSMAGTIKDALSVEYTGTGSDSLVIYQGAGKNTGTFAGKDGSGSDFTNSRSDTIGFSFDNTASPQYKTETTSTFLDTVNAIDFATDPILSQTEPAAPDTTMDATKCTATATTVLNFAPNSESFMKAAKATCDTFPQHDNARMCDSLRSLEQRFHNAEHSCKNGGHGC
ncbi:MAG: hypothetical protein NTY08_13905 [Proteobacteria bacterium]|nr:hypothetical protein [Pseudomonadota bacterium]